MRQHVTPFLAFLSLFVIQSMTVSAQNYIHEADFETGNYNQPNCANPPCIKPCGSPVDDPCDCGEGTSIDVKRKDSGVPVRAGNYSSMHRVADCHERSEFFTGGGGYNFPKGEPVWIGWSTYIPEGFRNTNTNFTHIAQFHDTKGGSGGKCPDKEGHNGPTTFDIYPADDPDYPDRRNEFWITMRVQDQGEDCWRRQDFYLMDYPDMVGKWIDIVVNANFDNSDDGFMKIWVYEAGTDPGDPKVNYEGATYIGKPLSNKGTGPQFRMGMYKARAGEVNGPPMTLYTDELRSGRAADGIGFEEVAPGDGTITPPSQGTVLFSDDFNRASLGSDWQSEIQNEGNSVLVANNKLVMDFADGGGGATVWLNKFIEEDNLKIEYDLRGVDDNEGLAGYANFWNVTEGDGSPVNIGSRDGLGFGSYADLTGYYLQMKRGGSIGIREYLGCGQDDDCRVLISNEHAPIEANTNYRVEIIQRSSDMEVYMNGELWWSATDASPRTKGHFGFRLFRGKHEVDNFKVTRVDGDVAPPPPPSDDSSLQAEEANVGGGAQIDSDHSGFQGSGFVNFSGDGGYVEFNNVDGGSGGEAELTLRYALGNDSRTGLLIVNGQAQDLTTPGTGSWASWQELTVTVPLQAGTSNTIRLETNGDDLANLDQIEVEANRNSMTPDQLAGIYYLRHVASGKYMDTDPGEQVKVQNGNGNLDQQWQLAQVEGIVYNLSNLFEGRGMLDADDDGKVKWVVATPVSTFIDRQWEAEAVEGKANTYRFKSKRDNRGYLMIENNTVVYNSGNQGAATEWELEPVEADNARVNSADKQRLTEQSLEPAAVLVYPSPTSGKVHLPLGQLSEQPTRIRVLDITGREVLRTRVRGSKQAIELDLTKQQEGLYFIHLEGRQHQRILKVLKQ